MAPKKKQPAKKVAPAKAVKKATPAEVVSAENVKVAVGRLGGQSTKKRMLKKDPDYFRKISLMRRTYGGPKRKESVCECGTIKVDGVCPKCSSVRKARKK